MATIKGKLKTSNGDTMYPETSADKVSGLSAVATSGLFNDLVNKPTTLAGYGITDAKVTGKVITLGGNSVDISNADTVDGLHLNNQAMAYSSTLSIQIGCAGIAVKGQDTQANIFAKTGNLYGQLWYATDTQKYYRRSTIQTTASSANWRDDTSAVQASLSLPNQATDNPIYIKIDTKNKYFSALTKFFVTANYDNVNGSTTVTGYCRNTNQFYIESCNYNGNNLVGVYQVSPNTDVYYFKLNKYRSSYGGSADYSPTITILYNYSGSNPTITLINSNHSEYATVSAYNFVSVPSSGIATTSGAFSTINGVTVGSSPKFTDTTYLFAEGTTNGAFSVTPAGSSAQTIKVHGLGSMAYKSSLSATDIPNIDASKITSGTFADARISSASTWNAKYSKPSSGIPASDLAEEYYLASNPNGYITTDALDDYATESWVNSSKESLTNKVNSIGSDSSTQYATVTAIKNFVNSSIGTNTADFLDTLDVVDDLGLSYGAGISAIVTKLNAYSFTSKTNNDYCFVINKDGNGNTIYQRFKYQVNNTSFAYEYTLNNSSFTASQWESIQSGITSDMVAKFTDYNAHLLNTSNPHSVTFAQLGSRPTTLSGYGITDAKIQNGVITLGGNTITPLTQHQSISGKLDKVTSATTYSQLYGKNLNGTQEMRDLSGSAVANTIAYRRTGGTLQVGTPTDNADATTKLYVDNLIALMQPKISSTNKLDYSLLANTPTIPTKVGDLTNDSGFITNSALSGYATQTWVNGRGFLTSHQDISGKLDKSGGTMTGAITLGSGDGKGILMPTTSNINTPAGYTVLGFVNSDYVIGSEQYHTLIRTNANGIDIKGGANCYLTLQNKSANSDYCIIKSASTSGTVRGLAIQPQETSGSASNTGSIVIGYPSTKEATSSYKVDINGSLNATTIYENGSRVAKLSDIPSTSSFAKLNSGNDFYGIQTFHSSSSESYAEVQNDGSIIMYSDNEGGMLKISAGDGGGSYITTSIGNTIWLDGLSGSKVYYHRMYVMIMNSHEIYLNFGFFSSMSENIIADYTDVWGLADYLRQRGGYFQCWAYVDGHTNSGYVLFSNPNSSTSNCITIYPLPDNGSGNSYGAKSSDYVEIGEYIYAI